MLMQQTTNHPYAQKLVDFSDYAFEFLLRRMWQLSAGIEQESKRLKPLKPEDRAAWQAMSAMLKEQEEIYTICLPMIDFFIDHATDRCDIEKVWKAAEDNVLKFRKAKDTDATQPTN
jgi:hypothetical protein